MLERIQFIKVNRHKRYDYTPRYYDERKERLDALVKKYQEEENDDNVDTSSAEYRARIKQRIEQDWNMNSAQASSARAANVRLIIILCALLLITYFILDYVEIFSADVISIENIETTK